MSDIRGEYKVSNAWMPIDERPHKKPLAKQSLDQDEICINVYNPELKRYVGKWVKTADYISRNDDFKGDGRRDDGDER